MLRSPRTWSLFCCGLLTAAVVLAAAAEAWAWPRDKERKRLEVDLKEVMTNPSAYLNRLIRFRCRFAMNGNLFKHLNSPFNPVEYVNFAVWPIDARLWEREARKAVLPTLYLNKTALAEIAVLRDCQRYDTLWLTGEVVVVYAGIPWVRVEKVEKDKDKAEEINDATIAHLSEGMALLEQNQASLAVKHLEMALSGQVPQRHKGFVIGQLAAARVKAGDIAGGVQAYADALKHKPDDVELMLAYSRALLLAGQAQLALENAQRVIALSGENPEAYGVAGEAYARLGQIRKGV
ncbi:MAG: hypothetical protein N3A66_04190, partial [Planctomycetota bacterium]|nr:hypothetical protein [Planctomycetota bacterium]